MSQTTIGALILAGLAVYGIFMVAQGLLQFKKTSGSTETFYNADRGVNSFMLICSTAVSVFSGLSYYGWPGIVYTHGVGAFSGLASFTPALMFAIMGYRLWLLGKEYGFTTPTDFLRNRYYSEGYGLFCAILLVGFIIPYVALQLITIGNGVNLSSFGVAPYFVAVLFACAIIFFHVFGGGMKAVAWMDTFNFILAMGALAVVIISLTMRYFPNGGLVEAVNIVRSNPETAGILSHPGPRGSMNLVGSINQALTASVTTIVWPHIFCRCFIAKSKTNFESMAWGLPLGYAITFFGLGIIGGILAPAILGPGFSAPSSIVAVLSSSYSFPIVNFISILCLFAFAISTSESMLLAATGMLSKDIFSRYRYELKGIAIDQKKAVKSARYVICAMMVVVLIIVSTRPVAIVGYAYKLSSPFFGMILPATIGGLFWKRGSKEGAIAGTVAGVVVTTIGTFFIKSLPFGLSALGWALIVNVALYIIVSLCTKVPEEVVDKYITRVENYISAGNDVDAIVGNTILASTFRPQQLQVGK